MLLFPSRLCFPIQLPIPHQVIQESSTSTSRHSQNVAWPHGHTVGTL